MFKSKIEKHIFISLSAIKKQHTFISRYISESTHIYIAEEMVPFLN